MLEEKISKDTRFLDLEECWDSDGIPASALGLILILIISLVLLPVIIAVFLMIVSYQTISEALKRIFI